MIVFKTADKSNLGMLELKPVTTEINGTRDMSCGIGIEWLEAKIINHISIGSIWGHFLEVDEETLKEVSFDKGRVLIATENTGKICDKIQVIVDGQAYTIRVEEEDNFRKIHGQKESGEDDEVDRLENELEDNRMVNERHVDGVDDVVKQKVDESAYLEVEKKVTNAINGCSKDLVLVNVVEHGRVQTQCKMDTAVNVPIQNNQQAPLPKSAEFITSAVGENTAEIENADDSYDESSNFALGLDSIV
ncbi:hypothetical protein RHMOL_Rhmol02G0238700 [Rhododendron molle]|uniref:Uncharacterized protein n=1 Tax=Rhododendron molle TaxID=49168 RepID=A0ACC0PUT9_RHOML|nr:hypothetical protein RHMOL_Rhmol02G0238700 [Rhododendron molle]